MLQWKIPSYKISRGNNRLMESEADSSSGSGLDHMQINEKYRSSVKKIFVSFIPPTFDLFQECFQTKYDPAMQIRMICTTKETVTVNNTVVKLPVYTNCIS